MNEQEAAEMTLLAIRGAVAGLPKEIQIKIDTLADKIRTIVDSDKEFGRAALGLVGAEYAAKED